MKIYHPQFTENSNKVAQIVHDTKFGEMIKMLGVQEEH